MTKENKSLKIKTSSRRKFFKTAAKAGAVAAATVAMPNIARADGHVTLKMQAACIFKVVAAFAFTYGIATAAAAIAPVLAAVLKNLRLEDVLIFNDLFSFVIISPLIVN